MEAKILLSLCTLGENTDVFLSWKAKDGRKMHVHPDEAVIEALISAMEDERDVITSHNKSPFREQAIDAISEKMAELGVAWAEFEDYLERIETKRLKKDK